MTYKKCKELKDAGFPQDGNNITSFQGEAETVYVNSIDSGSNDYCYVPTLSELIEACGEGFHSLHKVGLGFRADGRKVTDTPKDIAEWDKMSIIEIGLTPEEAVANLWLNLNKI